MHLHGVLYLRGLSVNLFSMQTLVVKNVFPFYQEVEGKVVLRKQLNGEKKEQKALVTIDENGRSTLDCKVMKTEYGNSDAMQISVERLHEILGHAGQNAIDRMIREQLVNGIIGIKRGSVESCNICKLGKLH